MTSGWEYYLDTSTRHWRSSMNRKELPLSPEWLRELRDRNSCASLPESKERQEGASRLAERLGLSIKEKAGRRRLRG